MPRVVRPPVGFHLHVCSLQAISAMAASTLLDLANRRTGRDRQRCIGTRGRLSQQLLRYCDELYDATCQRIQLTQHVCSDSVWLHPGQQLRIDDRDTLCPCTPENVTVFAGVFGHIDWKASARTGVDAIASWIANYFHVYTNNVYSGYPDLYTCRKLFMDMVSRVYKDPHLLDSIALVLTKTMLTTGVAGDVREGIAQLDPQYDAHVRTILDAATDPGERLAVAIKCGLTDYVKTEADVGLIVRDYHTWVQYAIHTCDLTMFHCLWDYRPGVEVYPYIYRHLICHSLSARNYAVVQLLFKEVEERGIRYADWCGVLWAAVVDTEGADLLLQRGCSFHIADLELNATPEVLQHLISRGVSVTPESVDDAVDVMISDIRVTRILIDVWMKSGLPCIKYLWEAIAECSYPRVLTELINIFDTLTYDEDRRRCLAESLHARSNDTDIRCVRVCLRLGADIDTPHPKSGRTLLIKAVRDQNELLIAYLLDVGASTIVRDRAGKRALEYFNDERLGRNLRERLMRAMDAEENA